MCEENEFLVCEFCGKTFSRPCGFAIHCRACKQNPNRKPLSNNKGHRQSKIGGWTCIICNSKFMTRKDLYLHRDEVHPERKGIAWNKGLTKYTNERVRQCGETYHNNVINGTIIPSQLGKPISNEVKDKISSSLKIAHSEGRAHNIGESRWNNEHSYPEKWFISVLENEFGMIENVDYKTEFPFYKYSLDFAWPDKKICIEIDGEQHQRFQDQIRRDSEKDDLLKNDGWFEIRKSWKDIFNNPKLFIEEVRSILGK